MSLSFELCVCILHACYSTVTNSTLPGRSVRLYAQCARVNASGEYAPSYDPGAILVLAINLDNTTAATIELADAGTGRFHSTLSSRRVPLQRSPTRSVTWLGFVVLLCPGLRAQVAIYAISTLSQWRAPISRRRNYWA
jgi:hypothetical protein